MDSFDWKVEPIVDFLGNELLDLKSDLVELLKSAECSLEKVDEDWGISYLRLSLQVPQAAFRTVRAKRQEHEAFLQEVASAAFDGFDDASLRTVTISPKLKADPSWRGGVEQPVTVTSKQEDEIWKSPGLLRLFLSHKSDQKVALSNLRTQLIRYGIDCFLAHQEITPTKEWQVVIQHGLQTCDALLAVGTPGFKTSAYCMHEVGWGLGRGVLVLPILAGEGPEGFHAVKQGPTVDLAHASESAKRIALALCEDARLKPRIFQGIVRRLEQAPSGADTWAIWQAFSDLGPCPEEHRQDIIRTFEENPEAMKSTAAVPKFRIWKDGKPVPAPVAIPNPAAFESVADETDPFADD